MKGDNRMNDKAAGSNCRLSIESCYIHSITLNACMGCVKRPEEAFLPFGFIRNKKSQKKYSPSSPPRRNVWRTCPACLQRLAN